jgi:SMC interacting uncharacterized protein involved in chromosome segregation
VFDQRKGKETPVKTSSQDDKKVAYTTPRWVQAWFLRRSRDNWKAKYTELKADAKRLQNRVNDVSKSREKWRGETEDLQARVSQLEAEKAAMQEQLAALKKDGRNAGLGPAVR